MPIRRPFIQRHDKDVKKEVENKKKKFKKKLIPEPYEGGFWIGE